MPLDVLDIFEIILTVLLKTDIIKLLNLSSVVWILFGIWPFAKEVVERQEIRLVFDFFVDLRKQFSFLIVLACRERAHCKFPANSDRVLPRSSLAECLRTSHNFRNEFESLLFLFLGLLLFLQFLLVFLLRLLWECAKSPID